MANENIVKSVSEARVLATEMCNSGCMSHLPRAAYMNHVDVIMVVAASLIEALVFRSEERYVMENGRNVPKARIDGLIRAIAGIGEQEFNAPFIQFWMTAEKELKGPNVGIIMLQESPNVPYHNKIIQLCADWAIKTLSCGIMPSEVSNNPVLYNIILKDYERFCKLLLPELDFSQLPCATGIEAFNLQAIPNSDIAYDVFISYRRVDGDVGARLINQELEHRGFKCFLDVESVGNGAYNPQLLSALKVAPNFLFVLSPGAIQGLEDPDDPVRIELEAANKLVKNVVAVALPRMSRNISDQIFPPSLDYLRTLNIYRLDVGENYDASIERIITRALR